MLTGNLATRPFYNERLVRAVLAAALAVAAAWALFNAATVWSLSQQGAMLAERTRTEGLAAAAARRQAEAVRATLDARDVAAASRAASEANQLIARRTFSWTTLFNQVEATLPPDVRLTQVAPQTDRDGQLMLSLAVVSRRFEDLDEFIDRLEATGAFRGVLSRSDATLDDGSIASSLQGYYGAAAKAAPAASEGSRSPVSPGGEDTR